MRKYVVLNKFGRIIGVADSLQDIADNTGVPVTSIRLKYQQGKPIRGQILVMLREKHEYLWHKHGGRRGGDDFFAFCTPKSCVPTRRPRNESIPRYANVLSR